MVEARWNYIRDWTGGNNFMTIDDDDPRDTYNRYNISHIFEMFLDGAYQQD